MAREEFHRLKKIKEKKRQAREKNAKKKKDPCVSDTCAETRLEYLKQLLSDLIALGQKFIATGAENIDLDEFLNACEEAKQKMDQFLEEIPCQEIDEKLKKKLEHLGLHLCEVMNVTKQLTNKSDPCVCPVINNEYQDGNMMSETKPTDDKHKKEYEKLTENINNVLKTMEDYRHQGLLLSPSVESFIKSCNSFKSKFISESDKQKIEHLKEHIEVLENITSDIKKQEITTKGTEEFTEACKEFKVKLELLKSKGAKKPSDDIITTLIEHMDEGIKLGTEANEEGNESIEEFINTIKVFKEKMLVHTKKDETQDMSSNLNNLDPYIEEIMKIISKVLTECSDPEEVASIMKTNKAPEGKIQYCEKPPQSEDDDESVCDLCGEMNKRNELNSDRTCDTCSTSEASKSQDTYCEFCNKRMEAGEINSNVSKRKKTEYTPTDTNSRYFEKVVRKKVKLSRTLNKDGTVCEEKETVIIKSEKRRPNETASIDDDDTYVDFSESLLGDDDEKQIAVCTISNSKLRGLTGNTQSDTGVKTSPISDPVLRNCISLDILISCSLQDIYSISSSISIEDVFYTQ